MNKPMTGVVAGIGLGFLDGLTAWFTPAVRDQMASILAGSSVKGMLVGLVSGLLARKVNSVPAGVAVAATLGLGLAYLVASMPQPDGTHYWAEIMIPGFVTGALIGFITQRY